jgi:hypothetical protein
MIAATDERDMLARLDRLERVVAMQNAVSLALLKAQHPFMPLDTFGVAQRRLEEVADLLKSSKGESR